MSLLPSSRPEVRAEQEGELRLLGFNEDTIDDALDAISSETARALLRHIHDEPRTPSELADRTNSSVQNVSYHLEKLGEANLIQVMGTQYSEKGREMEVYGPADEPLVMFIGTERRKLSFKQLLKRFIGATGLLGVLSILLHSLIEEGLPYINITGEGATGAGGIEPTLPLSAMIFLGGFTMLLVLFAWRYWEVELDELLACLWNASLFAGRNRDLSKRVGLVTTGVSVVLVVASLAITSFGAIPAIGLFVLAPVFMFALVGAAAIQAYYNDGLIISWMVVFVPVAVFGVTIVGIRLAGEGLATVAGIIGYPVILGAVGALIFGTVGFLLGAGSRRLVTRIKGSIARL